jgi:hypothetical protein
MKRLREIIPLNEKYGGKLNLVKNPGHAGFMRVINTSKFKEARILRDGPDWWVWPAEQAFHHDVALTLPARNDWGDNYEPLHHRRFIVSKTPQGNLMPDERRIDKNKYPWKIWLKNNKEVHEAEKYYYHVTPLLKEDIKDNIRSRIRDLQQIQSKENAKFLGARVLRNPQADAVENQTKKSEYKTLRYLMHKDKVWTVDANDMMHGNLADRVGVGRDEWVHNSLTGFVKNNDIPHIKKQGFKQWIQQRHKDRNDDYINDDDDD